MVEIVGYARDMRNGYTLVSDAQECSRCASFAHFIGTIEILTPDGLQTWLERRLVSRSTLPYLESKRGVHQDLLDLECIDLAAVRRAVSLKRKDLSLAFV
jgi:hypothetical protein